MAKVQSGEVTVRCIKHICVSSGAGGHYQNIGLRKVRARVLKKIGDEPSCDNHENEGIDSIEHSAMSRNQVAAILHAPRSFEHRFGKIAGLS
jgi:hypothetical protein